MARRPTSGSQRRKKRVSRTALKLAARPAKRPIARPATPASSAIPCVVIVTALGVETEAVLRHLPEWNVEDVGGTSFHRGRFGAWDVAVAEAGAGNARAASVGARALAHFRPRVALFVGVAGGVKDVKLGDVVVATKVYGYEAGNDNRRRFKPRPDLANSAHAVESLARAIRQRQDWRRRLKDRGRSIEPEIHVGPIAAGEKVVASQRSGVAKFLADTYGDALAVEMEGRGFLEAVHLDAPVLGGVIRGISDLLSGKAGADRGGSQQRAADAAAAVAFEILASMEHPKTKPGLVEISPPSAAGAPFTGDFSSEPIIEEMLRKKQRVALGLEINPHALRIEIGESGKFFSTTGRPYRTERTFYVKVENIDKSRPITGCKVQVTKIEPHEYDGPWLLKHDFALAAGDHEFIPLVTYGESQDQSKFPCGDSFMILRTPFFPEPKPSSSAEHLVTLKATSLETAPCEVQCKVWVNSEGRLKIAKVESEPVREHDRAASALVEPQPGGRIHLRDAARIAYEQTQGLSVGEVVDGNYSDPEERLSYFINGMLLHKIGLMGRSPPSTVARAISQDKIRELHPVPGTSNLRTLGPAGGLAYVDVTVSQSDLNDYIEHLRLIGASTEAKPNRL